jgi:hypothetical protein
MSITKQPQALQSLDLYSDLHTSNEKHGYGQGGDCEGCPSSRAGHRNCHKSRLRRLLFPSVVALVVLGAIMLFSCFGGHEVIGWGAEDLVKRATGTTTGSGGTFTHNKRMFTCVPETSRLILFFSLSCRHFCGAFGCSRPCGYAECLVL